MFLVTVAYPGCDVTGFGISWRGGGGGGEIHW